ncbi:O-antigen polysaccharide polymerase Wzy [Paenibacillus sp. J2TS4]|uniref:O-antigen polysaccharide polymerase Wzy n=1 Tax=Paenibacillus sp. J2TS4 TaxID=2807194 RepID=UPI001B00D4B2|nr:O-antigen polysaccharide polymerase Wzy [Paenibacillus sp. J2TS4]GIP35027.1 hypothetical protein J2TS4_42370 [Paenibacillus sp. J2TS4]
MGVFLIEVLAIVFNIIFLLKVIKNINRGKLYTVNILIFVFFVFFVLPLILDLIVGVPNYERHPGFYYSSKDTATRIIYALYIMLAPVIMYKVGKPKESVSINAISYLRKYRVILYFLIVLPILIVLFSPNPLLYLQYAVSSKGLLGSEEAEYHALILFSSRLSMICISLVMLIGRKKYMTYVVLFAPLLFLDIWLYGKRSIVALTLVALLFVAYKRNVLRGKKIVAVGLLAVTVLLLFSNFFQQNVRKYDDYTFDQSYLNFRIDYGRDDVTRLAIYSELEEDLQILEYRGQSLLFYLTLYVPRSMWPDKPYPYAQYMTSALFLSEPKLWGWGMTTSILEEMIANFSWLGFIIGPLILGLICRIGDNTRESFISLLTVIFSALLLVVHLTPIYPIFLIWLFSIIFIKIRANIKRKAAIRGDLRWIGNDNP